MEDSSLEFYILRKRINDEVNVPLFNESYVMEAHFHFSEKMITWCKRLHFSDDIRDDLFHYIWKPERLGYYYKNIDEKYANKIKEGLDKMSALAKALRPFERIDDLEYGTLTDLFIEAQSSIDDFCVELASLKNKLDACVSDDTEYYIVSWS